jgi:hypothetical protein
MGKMRNACILWFENPEGRGHLENKGVDGRIILERILWKWGGMVWTLCIWYRIGTSDGLL